MPLIRVCAWGYNSAGQLGDGTTTNRSTPVQVKGPGGVGYLTGITAICGGGNNYTSNPHGHSLALKSDGTVWAWGYNGQGQLGDGTTTSSSTPVQVKGPGGVDYLTDVIAIAAGTNHSLALKSDGTVWAWGYNNAGQLGDGTTTNRSTPVQVKGPGGVGYLTDVIAIAAGGYHSLALKSDGTVFAWGNNTTSQLGDGTTTNRSTPVQVKGPGGVDYLTDVTAISCGGGADGTLNMFGHSLALKSDGTVWAWGYNIVGQLGDGTTTNRSTPVQVKGPGGVGYLTGITAISAGARHSLAAKNGTVWAWGSNATGQLGDGTTTNRSTPVQVKGPGGVDYLTDVTAISGGKGDFFNDAATHSLALKSDGTVWAWGYNIVGQLGDGTTTSSSTPVQVKGPGGVGYLTGITAISAGAHHSLAANTKLALIFADSQGLMLTEKNLGQFLAGSSVGPTGIDLYNGTGLTVTGVSVTRQNLPPDDTVEISATADPFAAEDPLSFSGTFQPEQQIGTVYVRVTAPVLTGGGQPNQGIKEFDLQATSTQA